MAHRKCTADAVWPPKFRPSLDPNEVLRQISALCAHLAKLSQLSGVPSELPIPQTLPFARLSETTQSAMTSSSPEIVGTEPTREEKTEAAVPAERAKTQVGRKRREQPVATPRQTPPPRPKRPPPTKLRLMMKKTTRTEKSAEGTPTPPSPTSMEKPAKGTPEPTPPSPRWDRMTHEFGEAMREYTLSNRVRAGGGTLKKEKKLSVPL